MPTLPYTKNGNVALERLGFRIAGDQRFNFSAETVNAVPASQNTDLKVESEERHDRALVEGCTNPGSLLSKHTKQSDGCKVIPVDRHLDWRSTASFDTCIKHLKGANSALWFSSPCTGGSMWTYVNMHRGSETVKKIRGHWAEFRRLWKRYEEVAKEVIPLGVAMFIEWPRGCRYWTNCHVKRFIKKFEYTFIDFDGCMYGLVATKGKDAGKLINKPWRVAYLNSNIGEILNKRCDRSHEHAPCSGQNTKITEGYTPSIARIVHSCFKDDACKRVRSTYPAAIARLKPIPGISPERIGWADLLMDGRPDRLPVWDQPGTAKDPVDTTDYPTLGEAVDTKVPKGPKIAAPRAASRSRWSSPRPTASSGDAAASSSDRVLPPVQDEDANVEIEKHENVNPGRTIPLREYARFVPTMGQRLELVSTLTKFHLNSGKMYLWLKGEILSCNYVIPGLPLNEIKMATVAMIVRMIDPDELCGDSAETTKSIYLCRSL